MSIVNRRNAFLGWAAWQVGKRVARRKARAAVPGIAEGSRRPNRAGIVALVAAAAGALWLWRKGRDDEDGWTEPGG